MHQIIRGLLTCTGIKLTPRWNPGSECDDELEDHQQCDRPRPAGSRHLPYKGTQSHATKMTLFRMVRITLDRWRIRGVELRLYTGSCRLIQCRNSSPTFVHDYDGLNIFAS